MAELGCTSLGSLTELFGPRGCLHGLAEPRAGEDAGDSLEQGHCLDICHPAGQTRMASHFIPSNPEVQMSI